MKYKGIALKRILDLLRGRLFALEVAPAFPNESTPVATSQSLPDLIRQHYDASIRWLEYWQNAKSALRVQRPDLADAAIDRVLQVECDLLLYKARIDQMVALE